MAQANGTRCGLDGGSLAGGAGSADTVLRSLSVANVMTGLPLAGVPVGGAIAG
jgi:hypothetical protein